MGSSFGIFVRFTKRSIVRVLSHESRKSSAKTTARFRKFPKRTRRLPLPPKQSGARSRLNAEIGAFGENFRPTPPKKKAQSRCRDRAGLRLSRCLAWSQRPPATRARAARHARATCASRGFEPPRRESLDVRRCRCVRGSTRADRVPTADDDVERARDPSFDGVAGSRRVHHRRRRARRCPSRVAHRVLLVASALASSPRLARTARARARRCAAPMPIDKYVFLRRLQQRKRRLVLPTAHAKRDGDHALRVHAHGGRGVRDVPPPAHPDARRLHHRGRRGAPASGRSCARAQKDLKIHAPGTPKRRIAGRIDPRGDAKVAVGDGRRAHLGAGRPGRRRRRPSRRAKSCSTPCLRGTPSPARAFPCAWTSAPTTRRSSRTHQSYRGLRRAASARHGYAALAEEHMAEMRLAVV